MLQGTHIRLRSDMVALAVVFCLSGLTGCGKGGGSFTGASLGAPPPRNVLDPARLNANQARVWNHVLTTHYNYLKVEGPGVRGHYFTAVVARLNLLPPTGVTLSEAQVICLLGLPDYTEDSGSKDSRVKWRALHYLFLDKTNNYKGKATVYCQNGLTSSTGFNAMPDPIPGTWQPCGRMADGGDRPVVAPLSAQGPTPSGGVQSSPDSAVQ